MGKQRSQFCKSWIRKGEYNNWLDEASNDTNAAYCKLCKKSFSLSNMGKAALDSHMRSSLHITVVREIEKTLKQQPKITGFQKNEQSQSNAQSQPGTSTPKDMGEQDVEQASCGNDSSASSATSCASSVKQTLLEAGLVSKQTQIAECLWVVNTILKHQSFNANGNDGDLFKKMFPDSPTAEKFALGKDKLSYLVNFGFAEYVIKCLVKHIRQSGSYVVAFDGSFNKILQQEQLDIHIRFQLGRHVITRYFNSKFLGHAKHTDIMQALRSGTEQLDDGKCIQISMDGPATNLKVLKEFISERECASDKPQFLNIGSCILHIVHGAFATGNNESGYNLDGLLKALFYLFEDCGARRSDLKQTSSFVGYPFYFCKTRWVEDVIVAEQAIKVWPSIKEYIKTTEKKPKREIPTAKSYTTVREAVKDKLVIPKLQLFITIARQLTPFLTKYQSDKPMVPFLAGDYEGLVRDMMVRLVKPDVLQQAAGCTKLMKIDVREEKNLVLAKKVDVGFATKHSLEGIHDLTKEEVLGFFVGARKFLVGTVAKLVEKSPLKYSLVKGMSSLDPAIMRNDPTLAASLFRLVLEVLGRSHWLSDSQCEIALQEYRNLLRCIDVQGTDITFNESTERLDDFWLTKIPSQMEGLVDTLNVIKLVLPLSHGQATVERGFSTNTQLLQPNMKEKTLVSLRLVHNYLTSSGIHNASDFEVTNELLDECR